MADGAPGSAEGPQRQRGRLCRTFCLCCARGPTSRPVSPAPGREGFQPAFLRSVRGLQWRRGAGSRDSLHRKPIPFAPTSSLNWRRWEGNRDTLFLAGQPLPGGDGTSERHPHSPPPHTHCFFLVIGLNCFPKYRRKPWPPNPVSLRIVSGVCWDKGCPAFFSSSSAPPIEGTRAGWCEARRSAGRGITESKEKLFSSPPFFCKEQNGKKSLGGQAPSPGWPAKSDQVPLIFRLTPIADSRKGP